MKTKRLLLLFFLTLFCCCGKSEEAIVLPPPPDPEEPTEKPAEPGPEPGEQPGENPSTPAGDYIIVGYAYADSGELPDPALLTHINFSFAKIQDDFETLSIRDKKIKRLQQIVGLKARKPELKVLLSVGGWGAGNFSEMAADESHRKNFCANCLKMVQQYGLDGIDLDWEYPTSSSAGISASPDDTRNFTLLLKDLRETLGPDRLVTMASEASAHYVDWKSALEYLDFVNIMSYDMGRPPSHNAALYKGSRTKMSCDEAVAKHFAAGVPYEKMTLGMAFFGRVDRNILQGDELDYREILGLTGYNKNWDAEAMVPYLTDAAGTMVLSYDDETSIGLKADYVKQKGLLGAMYWDIEADDDNHSLGKAVASRLLPESAPEEDAVLVTNEYVEKFLEEVTYRDRDFSYSLIMDYPGGGPGEADIPPSITLSWTADATAGALTLRLSDEQWSRTWTLPAGTASFDVRGLVPGSTYSYIVTGTAGQVVGSGSFRTRGLLHQLYFEPAVRNIRDMGGWKTTDGQTVRFRKLYRGGKVSKSNMNDKGRAEALAEGIKAELDLRELEDVPSKSYFGNDIRFLAPGFDHGYRGMLRDRAEGIKQCFEFIVQCLRDDCPVYFHCAAGRDRTGTIAILLLGVLGVPEGEIGKDYELTYFSPADWSMQEDGLYHHMRTAEGSYVAAHEYIWKIGASGDLRERTEKYLLSIGVTQQDIDDLRTIMLK